MYIYPLLMCGGIAFFANALFSDSTLFDDDLPLSTSLAAGDDFGSNFLLDHDTVSTSNLIGVEPNDYSNFDPNSVVSEPDVPLDEDWLSSTNHLIEDETNLGKSFSSNDNSKPNFYDQPFDTAAATDGAANQCILRSSSPFMSKLRNRGDARENFFNPSPAVKLPDVEDANIAIKQQKWCLTSQWATFGNIPVCAIWPDDINPISHAVLGIEGSLALPLNGWVYVYRYLYYYSNICNSNLVYCCNAFLPLQNPSPASALQAWQLDPRFAPPSRGTGYWCVPGSTSP